MVFLSAGWVRCSPRWLITIARRRRWFLGRLRALACQEAFDQSQVVPCVRVCIGVQYDRLLFQARLIRVHGCEELPHRGTSATRIALQCEGIPLAIEGANKAHLASIFQGSLVIQFRLRIQAELVASRRSIESHQSRIASACLSPVVRFDGLSIVAALIR
jgi:hypothetical protein